MVGIDAMASTPHADDSPALTTSCLRACVSRAVEVGELAADTPVATLAFVFDGFLFGLTSLARDGAKLPAMASAIDDVLRFLHLHAAS